jgi:hypothetical protein
MEEGRGGGGVLVVGKRKKGERLGGRGTVRMKASAK